jgi:hypothetical protein
MNVCDSSYSKNRLRPKAQLVGIFPGDGSYYVWDGKTLSPRSTAPEWSDVPTNPKPDEKMMPLANEKLREATVVQLDTDIFTLIFKNPAEDEGLIYDREHQPAAAAPAPPHGDLATAERVVEVRRLDASLTPRAPLCYRKQTGRSW